MADITGFFLGANTPSGFLSLYDTELAVYDRLYILKGSPGCGKSTFMRRCAQTLEGMGVAAEYILCSSDTNSLDGVIFPTLGAAVVDGTAPHVAEPRYPLAGEYYINFGEFCDGAALRAIRPKIRALTDAYRAVYGQVYNLLRAAGDLRSLRLKIAMSHSSGLIRRAEGIVRNEIGKKAKRQPGMERVRFLSTICSEGVRYQYAAARALCSRIYEIRTEYDLGRDMLEAIRDSALRAGHDIVSCPAPWDPDGPPEHVLIPELGLGFLTVERAHPLEGGSYRRILADRTLDNASIAEVRPQLRLLRLTEDSIVSQIVSVQRRAAQIHDRLEALYNPHVDFPGVFHAAEALANELFQKT